jgi:hypothetical protein
MMLMGISVHLLEVAQDRLNSTPNMTERALGFVSPQGVSKVREC